MQSIEKHLDENRLRYDHISYDYPDVNIEIPWGDWKHEHLRLQFLMEELGYVHIYEYVTESDGSDCYSAVHQFRDKKFMEEA